MIFFTEDMKIGIPHIDEQHKSLVDFANRATLICSTNPSRELVIEYFDFLGNYVMKHFNAEENLQIECRYPRYKRHREIHQEFIINFGSIYSDFVKYGSSDKLIATLNSCVANWITTHIKGEDTLFGKHFTQANMDHLTTYISKR